MNGGGARAVQDANVVRISETHTAFIRIVGFLNLVLAWIVASVLIYQGMTSMAALALLLATATLLAIITYLTQSRDELLASQ